VPWIEALVVAEIHSISCTLEEAPCLGHALVVTYAWRLAVFRGNAGVGEALKSAELSHAGRAESYLPNGGCHFVCWSKNPGCAHF